MFNAERGLLGIFLLDINLVSLSLPWLKKKKPYKSNLQEKWFILTLKVLLGTLTQSPWKRRYNNRILRQVGRIASTIKKQKQREIRKEGWTMKTTGPASSDPLLPASCFLLNLPRQHHLLGTHEPWGAFTFNCCRASFFFWDAVCGGVIIVTSSHSSLLTLSQGSVHTRVN